MSTDSLNKPSRKASKLLPKTREELQQFAEECLRTGDDDWGLKNTEKVFKRTDLVAEDMVAVKKSIAKKLRKNPSFYLRDKELQPPFITHIATKLELGEHLVSVKGLERPLVLSSRELGSFKKLQMAALYQGHTKIWKPVRRWKHYLHETYVRLQREGNLTKIPLPSPEVSVRGQFKEILCNWLEPQWANHNAPRDRDGILMGFPWRSPDDGRWYFLFNDLLQEVLRKELYDYNDRLVRSNMISVYLRELNGGIDVVCWKRERIQKKYVTLWWVPDSVIEREA